MERKNLEDNDIDGGYIKNIRCEDMNWIELVQNMV
jgi:hypothetical protein